MNEMRDQIYFLKDLTNPPEKSLHQEDISASLVGEAQTRCHFKPESIFEREEYEERIQNMKYHIYLVSVAFFRI